MITNQQSGFRNHLSDDLFKAWMDGLTEVSSSPKLMLQIERENDKLLLRFTEQYERLRALPRTVRRAMQRKWKHSLAGIALLMALGSGSAAATTFDIPCDNGVGDSGALIQAINDSNDEIANPGEDMINLGSNCIHTLTAVDNGTYGDTGLPVINSEITIDGNGSVIQRDSGMSTPGFRIFAVNDDGNLTLQESTVTGGESVDSGGGLYNRGTVTLNNSTVSGNFAYSGGGGLSNRGTMTLINSTVSGNVAYGDFVTHGGGGGLSNIGTMTLINSTVSGNAASHGGFGGGLNNIGTMTLNNSTVSGNGASIRGGGLYCNNYSTTTLNRSLVSGNVRISQATGNFTNLSDEIGKIRYYSTVHADNFNLFGHDGDAGVSGFSPGATDIVPDVPLNAILNPTLADNGGSTPTHALLIGSPAVDAVETDCPPPTTDQRGVSRPQGARCDISAFELESSTPPPSPSPSLTPSPGPPGGNGGCTIAQVGAMTHTPLYLLAPLFMLIRRLWRRYRN